MRFHALLPVRDEADIVGQCLAHLLLWADAIYVFDTGSVDATWDIVQDYAHRDARVIALRRDAVYFSETRLRGWMFEQARREMQHGDWFLRVDADEFHHIAPPTFVKERMRPGETIAYHQYYDFQLLESEAAAWEHEKEPLTDRARPIEERRRWFVPSVYSEPRLCRYRSTMQWPPTVSFPHNAGLVARARLPIRHYPHRDPAQLARRCRLRAIMMADSENRSNWSRPELHHWAESDWRRFVAPDGREDLRYWAPGTALPEFAFENHLARGPKRLLQRLVHSHLLPFLDSRRQRWPADAYPQRIPDQISALLSDELRI